MTFPSWRYGPNGDARVCADRDDVPPGWSDHPRGPFPHPLDRDGDGSPGGSRPKGQAKPGELTDREINADLEAMGIEPDPTIHKPTRLKQRNAARAAREP